MSERQDKIKTILVTFFPMFIATLSLVTAIYNGYLNGKFVDIIQRNVGRTEYMRTCKETIDAYFQVKFRAGVVAQSGGVPSAAGAAPPSAADVDAAKPSPSLPRSGLILPICAMRPSGATTPICRSTWSKRCAKPSVPRRPTCPSCSSRPTGCSPGSTTIA